MQKLAKSAPRRSRSKLSLEVLEVRTLMAADFGATALTSAAAAQQTASESFPRFGSDEAMREQLIEAAVERYRELFGQYRSTGGVVIYDGNLMIDTAVGRALHRDYSPTNVQTAGVDEADVVKTDGNYLYFVEGRSLVIVDTHAADELKVVSRIELPGTAAGIYLLGDRLTVITQRSGYESTDYPIGDYANGAERPFNRSLLNGQSVGVAVYDIADRALPKLITETDFEGRLVESRMIGSQVYVITQAGFYLPSPISRLTEVPPPAGDLPVRPYTPSDAATDYWGGLSASVPYWIRWPQTGPEQYYVYESEAEFRERVGQQILEDALPQYTTYGAQGQTVRSGRISNGGEVHDRDLVNNTSLVSVLVFDATGASIGVQSSTTLPAGNVQQIYATANSIYLVEGNFNEGQQVSDIYRFDLENSAASMHGAVLAAVGEVPGSVINQFSLDEYNGYLRVATQTGWGQTARSGVYVLELEGDEMEIVGRLENLTPGERLFSSRFVGDRGFLVTFGPQGTTTGPEGTRITPFNWVDPLLTIDLSDPTNPQLKGQLVIPGFSNYLQIVDGHYLIGFGRDADTTTGRWTDAQVSIFDVADLSSPVLLDRFVIPNSSTLQSDAFSDHHAISYFADQHILAIPMNDTRWETVVDGLVSRNEQRTYSELWVFKVDPTSADALQSLGQVALRSTLYRSVRIDDELYSIAGQIVQANRLDAPAELLGQVYFGAFSADAQFQIDRTGPTSTLNVLDRFVLPESVKNELHVTAVEAAHFGSVAISPNGKSVQYTIPADPLRRDDSFTFTVTDAKGRSETRTVTIRISFAVDGQRLLQVAKNDLAAKLGVDVNEIRVGGNDDGEYPQVYVSYQEKVWTDTTLSTSDGEATAPTPGFEFVLNYRKNLFIYHSDLNSNFILAREFLRTELDEVQVPENSTDNVLTVTANDYDGVRHYKLPQLVSVTVGNHGGTARLSDDGTQVIYTPAADFIGVEELTYKLANGETGKVKVRISWERLAAGATALAIADLADKLGTTVQSLTPELSVTSVTQRVTSDNRVANQMLGEDYKYELTIGFEIHLNYRGIDVEYDTNGDRAVWLGYAPQLIIADEFQVGKNNVGVTLEVRANDYPGTYYWDTPRPITAVSGSAAGGIVEIVGGAHSQQIRYTPPKDFSGVDTFTYTVGNMTVPVKVTVEAAAEQAALRIVARDSQGEIASIFTRGEDMVVEIYAIDTRDGEHGLLAADFKLLFDTEKLTVEDIDYGSGSSAADDADPLHVRFVATNQSTAQVLLATVRLCALGDGPLTLSTSSADGGTPVVGVGGTVVTANVRESGVSLRVMSTPAMNGTPVTTGGDAALTARDVLAMVNRLNSQQNSTGPATSLSVSVKDRLGFGVRPVAIVDDLLRRADANGNGRIDATDVLRAVNRLNQLAARDLVFAGLN